MPGVFGIWHILFASDDIHVYNWYPIYVWLLKNKILAFVIQRIY